MFYALYLHIYMYADVAMVTGLGRVGVPRFTCSVGCMALDLARGTCNHFLCHVHV